MYIMYRISIGTALVEDLGETGTLSLHPSVLSPPP